MFPILRNPLSSEASGGSIPPPTCRTLEFLSSKNNLFLLSAMNSLEYPLHAIQPIMGYNMIQATCKLWRSHPKESTKIWPIRNWRNRSSWLLLIPLHTLHHLHHHLVLLLHLLHH